jgi:very-short-patch-repair endonuclease
MKRSRARSPEAVEFARSQRATANEFTRTVWQWVRNRQICNQKFRREHPIPPNTADFCCVELKLILEIDGADHFISAGQERDRVRDDFLNRQGYRIVRISGYEVLRAGNEVIQSIREQVAKRMQELGVEGTRTGASKPLTPDPSPRSGERGDE